MATRTTFTLDDALAGQARRLGINISAAARDGVAEAVRSALANQDREADIRQPEAADEGWDDAEAWGEERTAAMSGWLRSARSGLPSSS